MSNGPAKSIPVWAKAAASTTRLDGKAAILGWIGLATARRQAKQCRTTFFTWVRPFNTQYCCLKIASVCVVPACICRAWQRLIRPIVRAWSPGRITGGMSLMYTRGLPHRKWGWGPERYIAHGTTASRSHLSPL
ncbi:hypothetical protein T03_6439 [Trichinella britovi]|uniref:Uncharacterized protein n=1 Tax=Trichinella britovi TaxID=45882 RepID=A0A0V1D4V1_TRIBR|nr:hypothetical protein T03_6439 [Trichinella britovi]